MIGLTRRWSISWVIQHARFNSLSARRVVLGYRDRGLVSYPGRRLTILRFGMILSLWLDSHPSRFSF